MGWCSLMVLPASSWGACAPLGLGLWGGPLLLWMGYCGEEKRSLRFESSAKFGVQSNRMLTKIMQGTLFSTADLGAAH